MTTPEPQPQIAVWYFIGATFVFALPNLLFRDGGLWVAIPSVAFGIILMVLGFFQLRREIQSRRGQGEPPQPPPPAR